MFEYGSFFYFVIGPFFFVFSGAIFFVLIIGAVLLFVDEFTTINSFKIFFDVFNKDYKIK